jgi:uncharacterized protein YoxC
MSKLEEKKRGISERKQKSKDLIQSVTAQHDSMEILIDSVNDMHDSILELTELVRAIATPNPLDDMRKTEPVPVEVKPTLWGRIRGDR